MTYNQYSSTRKPSKNSYTHRRIARRQQHIQGTPTPIVRRPTRYTDKNSSTNLQHFFQDHPLVAATLKPATRKAYLSAFLHFQRSPAFKQIGISSLDETINCYIEENYADDPAPARRQEMTNLLSYYRLATLHKPEKLALSKRSIAGWAKMVPSKSALPLTRNFLVAFIQRMIEKEHKTAAAALAIQWACYARSSEILSLKHKDIAQPVDIRISHYKGTILGINIQCAKTGQHQFTHVKDKQIIALAQCYLLHKTDEIYSFPLSYSEYLSTLKETAAYFQLSNRIKPHSERIGGAIHDLISGISAEAIASIRRWSTLSSLQHYLKNGRSWIMTMQMGKQSQKRLDKHIIRAAQTLDECPHFGENQS